jgi:hypothetical protein
MRAEAIGSPAAEAGSARSNLLLYLSVGLVAGAVIALQINIMRLFSVGSWAHFGSLVVSLAMLGFGLTSVIMTIAKGWFERHWKGVIALALLTFGPLMVASCLLAQQVPFNAIFLTTDPQQKWRLFANFMLYLLPFLSGAFFLGTVFLKHSRIFGRVYFADLAGSGLCGLVILGAMYVLPPEDLIVAPLLLWALGALLWFLQAGSRLGMAGIVVLAAASIGGHFVIPGTLGITKLAVSDYKGVAYARKFPDAERVYRSVSPFGDLEIYASSFLHFAPGLSDNAAFNLPQVPSNAYQGLYIDGEGPSGIMRDLPASDTEYFRYLPMFYPYVLKANPKTFVTQLNGGISTVVALRANSSSVTVAEGNPAILRAFQDPGLRTFTGDLLGNSKIRVIDYDGRLYAAHTNEKFDVVDLSLADSAGLSNPGGFAIVEKYPYTVEAMRNYMRALNPGGILSVTLWNKEEPPKSIFKLYATMAEAAREIAPQEMRQSFFVVSTYLATTTVLYKRGGFTAEEIGKLQAHTRAMSFDEIYSPGFEADLSRVDKILADYWNNTFVAGDADPTSPDAADADEPPPGEGGEVLASTALGRAVWHYLIEGGWDDVARRYVFDTRPLTNDRPYFAAYVRPGDLSRTIGHLDQFQDEWGYMLLWATLAIACITAASLVILPVIFGWRVVFSRYPGKLGAILYFACLGAGYIMVEVGLINHFILALSNPTVSASVLITGMLVFSGLGSLVSERILPRARQLLPLVLLGIGALLIGYGVYLDYALDWIGGQDYAARLLLCFALIAPPAFLMGFPMPTAMTTLGRLGKEHMFVWAWGINGCFSVIGAAAVPIIATAFGLGSVLEISGAAYLIAIPAFFAVLLPHRGATAAATA